MAHITEAQVIEETRITFGVLPLSGVLPSSHLIESENAEGNEDNIWRPPAQRCASFLSLD